MFRKDDHRRTIVKNYSLNDIEILIEAKRILMGWKAAGQPINIESQGREGPNESLKRTGKILTKGNY